MVVFASTVKALTNSSKSREFEVTKRALVKVGFVLKAQAPVMVWVAEREAGPLVQSKRTNDVEATELSILN